MAPPGWPWHNNHARAGPHCLDEPSMAERSPLPPFSPQLVSLRQGTPQGDAQRLPCRARSCLRHAVEPQICVEWPGPHRGDPDTASGPFLCVRFMPRGGGPPKAGCKSGPSGGPVHAPLRVHAVACTCRRRYPALRRCSVAAPCSTDLQGSAAAVTRGCLLSPRAPPPSVPQLQPYAAPWQ